MAYTTINKHTAHFNTKLFTGNSSTNAITGIGFQPDAVWLKSRSGANDHQIYDAVRGATKYLRAESNDGEGTASTGLTAFDSDGFTVGSAGTTNNNGATMASWNWKANGAGSANTVGTINSTVSANTTAGFSIVKYTGNGVSGATVGHGLGVAPKIVLIKKTSSSDSWSMLNTNIDLNYYLKLEGNDAQVNDALFNNTAPSTTVFTVDSDGQVNGNGNEFIAYCFAEVTGYSKFGKYTGNASTDGTFVYTGFKPAWIMTKRYNTTENWYIKDIKRSVSNPVDEALYANSSTTELANWSGATTDYLSNGFKIRTTDTAHNGSGDTYIYMAFGQSLVGSNNVPCTAR